MTKYFYRSEKNRMIAGVAGGIAEYFDVDPVIIRAAFIIALFAGGFSIPAYIILWIIAPDESKVKRKEGTEIHEVKIENEIKPETSFTTNNNNKDPEDCRRRNNSFKILAAVILITIGILTLLDRIFEWFDFGDFWPVFLIVLGIFILFKPNCKNQTQKI